MASAPPAPSHPCSPAGLPFCLKDQGEEVRQVGGGGGQEADGREDSRVWPGTTRRRTGPPGSQKAHSRPTMWGSLEDPGPNEAEGRGQQDRAVHRGDLPARRGEVRWLEAWTGNQDSGEPTVRWADWPFASSTSSQFPIDCHVPVAQGLQVALEGHYPVSYHK